MLTDRDSGAFYDVAQICSNGHVSNARARSSRLHNKKHCALCGAPTITCCPSCQTDIPGDYVPAGIVDFSEFEVPAHCVNCGKPYPWTESALIAASDLADELEELDEPERAILKQALPDLISDTPKSVVQATRFRKIMVKTGTVTVEAFRSILVGVLTEGAKKIMFPQP